MSHTTISAVPRLALQREVDVLLRSLSPNDPVTLLLAVIAFILLVAGGAFGVKRYRENSVPEDFYELLTDTDEITILTHPTPDPDAMATAMGVAHLADYTDTEITIQYPGEIRHQENRAFRTVLNLDAEQIDSVDDLASDHVVLVDHNSPRGFHGAHAVTPDAIIDHHPGSDDPEAEFTDIREEYGSCASIIAEYFSGLGFTPTTDSKDLEQDEKAVPKEVSTGLLHGMLTDTANFTRGCTLTEFDISKYLYSGIDADLLDRVVNPPVDAGILETVSCAIAQREVQGPYAISDVGKIDNVDALSQSADELLRLEGISTVIVMGDSEGVLHMSARSRDDRLHMGNLLEDLLDDVPMSNGGGHARMGGAQVSLPHLEGRIEEADSGMNRTQFKHHLFEKLKNGG